MGSETDKAYEYIFSSMTETDEARNGFLEAMKRKDILDARKYSDKMYSILFGVSLHIAGVISELEETLEKVPAAGRREGIIMDLTLMKKRYEELNSKLKKLTKNREVLGTNIPEE